MDPLQALFAVILLAIWYLTEAIGDALGFIVNHQMLSIVVIGSIAVLAILKGVQMVLRR